MKCPIDGVDLVMSERQGVEIDYCPTCRGVWLDRGELDKILDRAASMAASEHPAAPAPVAPAPAAMPPAPAAAYPAYPATPYGAPQGRPGDGYGDTYRGDDRDRYREGYREGYDPRRDPRAQRPYRKKKESWLGDLLDFD
jgi:hypothetical protein